MIRPFLFMLTLSPSVSDSPPSPVHAVMFELDYDSTFNISHAQAVSGYPSLKSCVDAMPSVMAHIVPMLDEGQTPQLQCTGIRGHGTQLIPEDPSI